MQYIAHRISHIACACGMRVPHGPELISDFNRLPVSGVRVRACDAPPHRPRPRPPPFPMRQPSPGARWYGGPPCAINPHKPLRPVPSAIIETASCQLLGCLANPAQSQSPVHAVAEGRSGANFPLWIACAVRDGENGNNGLLLLSQ